MTPERRKEVVEALQQLERNHHGERYTMATLRDAADELERMGEREIAVATALRWLRMPVNIDKIDEELRISLIVKLTPPPEPTNAE